MEGPGTTGPPLATVLHRKELRGTPCHALCVNPSLGGSRNHAGMKKAASIFLKPQQVATAWFDNKCVATPCGAAEEHSAMHPISTSMLVKNLKNKHQYSDG